MVNDTSKSSILLQKYKNPVIKYCFKEKVTKFVAKFINY